MEVDLRYLPAFLALAEERHFGRAAKRLHVSQPALSGQIRRLETGLELELFDRASRPIRLTSAGAAFLGEAKAAVYHARRAGERARRSVMGVVGGLTVGATFWAHAAIVPWVVRAFRARAPEVFLELPTFPPTEQIDALRAERLDVCFAAFGDRDLGERRGLNVEPLLEEPMVAIVPEDHPFAQRAQPSFDELATQPLVTLSTALAPGLFAKQLATFHERGLTPTDVQEVPDPYSAFSLIAGGGVVGLHMASYSNLSPPGVVFVPLGDAPTAALLMIWRRNDHRALVRGFLDTAREVARSLAPPRVFSEPTQADASRP